MRPFHSSGFSVIFIVILTAMLIGIFPGSLLSEASGQANPFISGGRTAAQEETAGTPETGTKFQKSSFTAGEIIRIQRRMRESLSRLMGQVKEAQSPGPLLLVLGISFLYGIVHALGPGHRKTVLVSYFLSGKSTAGQGVMAGNLLSLIHAGSAVITVTVIHWILRRSFSAAFDNVTMMMEFISYSAVGLLGTGMFINKICRLSGGGSAASCSHGKHDIPGGTVHTGKKRNTLPVIIATGIAPCPGAAMVMIFSISMNAVWLGVLSVISMSLGMAVTLAGIAVIAIAAKNRAEELSGGDNRFLSFLHEGLEVGGTLVIALFGLFMALPMIPYIV